MSDEIHQQKKLRKGTKSCIECRRRKIRCIWDSDDARACRRCEHKNFTCVAQTASQTPGSFASLTSRERISRLEQQVTTLTRALHGVETRLGNQPTFNEDFGDDATMITHSDEEMEGDSDHADELGEAAPAYLQSLFDNSVLSSNRDDINNAAVVSDRILVAARKELQRLIPSKEDVGIITQFTDVWLSLLNDLFPISYVTQTGREILSEYESMSSPSVDPLPLAIWLVSIAITVQQLPSSNLEQLSDIKSASHYARVVSDAVEQSILVHDSLVGTVEGIEVGLHFVRLQVGRGVFKKTWLTVRRVLSIAELIGLPQAARELEIPGRVSNLPDTVVAGGDRKKWKAESWAAICTLDRISAMMFNLPAASRGYPIPRQQIISPDGRVFTRAYLRRLTEIAMQVHDLEDSYDPTRTDEELNTKVSRLDGELVALAGIPPKEFWNDTDQTRSADRLLKYWHAYITLRTHLPLTLRRDKNQEYYYSRYTCINACQTTLHRYLGARPRIPRGLFMGRIIDLQALTAAVVLLLAYHSSTSAQMSQLQAQSIENPGLLIDEVVKTMEAVMRNSSRFETSAVSTIRSLQSLLRNDGTSRAQDMTLRVPLIGKIHVQRKKEERLPNAGINHNTPFVGDRGFSSTPMSTIMGVSAQTGPIPEQWAWDPLSWFVEDDREALFQTALMNEDYAQFDLPANGSISSAYS